jgi:hypothetical protein
MTRKTKIEKFSQNISFYVEMEFPLCPPIDEKGKIGPKPMK